MIKARDRLKQIYRLDMKMKRSKHQLEDIKQKMYTISAPQLDADRVKTSASGDDKLLKLIASVERIERRIRRETEKLIREYNAIVQEIERVPDERARTILMDRYVFYMRWEEIADQLGYVVGHIYRLHQQAVREFAKVNNYEY